MLCISSQGRIHSLHYITTHHDCSVTGGLIPGSSGLWQSIVETRISDGLSSADLATLLGVIHLINSDNVDSRRNGREVSSYT